MASAFIVVDTYFLAQVEDLPKWEDRFDLLVKDLAVELGPHFAWSESAASTDVDIVYVLYPPNHHNRIVEEQALRGYLTSRTGDVSNVHVFVVGRNPRGEKVETEDVMAVVDKQCTAYGVKGAAFRVLRPEDLDDHVRKSLGRLHKRRQVGVSTQPEDSALAPSSGVTKRIYPSSPAYESGDL